MKKVYRLEDDLMKVSRPKWGSARWWRLYKASFQPFAKCEKCGRLLLNPQSILIHQGGHCQKHVNPLPNETKGGGNEA